nr:hypothetical protein [Tanacetum cinerariifolium]
MMKVIKEGSKKHRLLKINVDSLACNSPLGIIFDEFSRLSGMHDDLFTYEVEIPGLPSIPCDKKEEDDSDDGDDEVELTNDEFSDPDNENLIDKDENRKAKWPTCNSNNEGFCNGGELLGMVRVGYMTYFHDFDWYDDLVDEKLKEEALKQKAIYEGSWGDATQGVMNFCARLKDALETFASLIMSYW